MKFEHVLQIYWSKGFLINGKLQGFHTSFKYLFDVPGGFGWPTQNALIRRFELFRVLQSPDKPIADVSATFATSLNLMFSHMTSINDTVFDLTRYNLLRLYLIKTTRGRAHALGKPSRGQRTWSNAWTAYNVNKTTRAFISAYQRVLKERTQEEKINYRVLKKKSLRKQRKEAVSKVTIKVNNWF